MFSMLNRLKSFIWGNEENPNFGNVEEILESFKETKFTSVFENVDDSIEVDSILDSDSNICEDRTGTITDINENYGFVDNKFYFERSMYHGQLEVEQRIKFLAFKRSEHHDWQIKKIYSVVDDSWDVKQPTEAAQVKDVLRRSVVCQVIERHGRDILCSPEDVKFSLDNVISEFTPCVGDWLTLEAIVEINEEVTDLSGEILHVEKVSPLRSRVKEGKITNIISDSGVIDNAVHFTNDACETGYAPHVGDRVVVEAIESQQTLFNWRAITVVPVKDSGVGNVKNQQNIAVQENDELFKNKFDIIINNFVKIENLTLGQKRECTVVIENVGQSNQLLLRGRFHSKRSESQLYIRPEYLDNKIVIYPRQKIEYSFLCHGKFVGFSNEVFVFTFKGFKIGCKFEIEVKPQASTSLYHNPDSKYNKVDLYSQQRNLQKDLENISTRGIRPMKAPAITHGSIGLFPVPKKLWTVILDNKNLNGKCTKDMEDNVAAIVPQFDSDLSFHNFKDRFHNLLYLEEIAGTLNMRRYDMDRACFRIAGPAGEYLCLEVEGLVEKRPSLIVGDSVLATSVCGDKKTHQGYIHKVLQKEIWLKFNPSFHSSFGAYDYHVAFQFGRSPVRRCHEAINKAVARLGPGFLFPDKLIAKEPQVNLEDMQEECQPLNDTSEQEQTNNKIHNLKRISELKNRKLSWFNKRLNIYQKEAVKNVLKGEARPLPYIIFGPPGTGKTITLVETMLQILKLIPESRILVATPSNSSANLIAERLLDSGFLRPGDIVRLVAYHCLVDGSLPEKLVPYCTTADLTIDKKKYGFDEPLKPSSTAKVLGRHRITIGTCIALGQLFSMGFAAGHFTHVMVDEAGQATEPEVLIPLSLLHANNGQAVLAGDPLQLGPVVLSTLAGKFGLGESFLSRIIHRFPYQRDIVGFPNTMGFDPRLVTKLVINYRSLPEILTLPNYMFYHSELQPWVSESDSPESKLLRSLAELLPPRDSGTPPAVMFHGIRGDNLQEGDCPSWYNPQEVTQVIYYVNQLYDYGLVPDDIGVITPYQRQVQKIRSLMFELDIEQPKIGSVEEFQGQERKVILLSTVRSSVNFIETDIRHYLGFVAAPKRLNVAITRAKSLLIILGNPYLLKTDLHWRTVLEYSIANGGYRGCDLPDEMASLQDSENFSEDEN